MSDADQYELASHNKTPGFIPGCFVLPKRTDMIDTLANGEFGI